MAYRYNSNRGKPYNKNTYTNFTAEKKEETEAQKKQKLETKFRLMIATEIAKKFPKMKVI